MLILAALTIALSAAPSPAVSTSPVVQASQSVRQIGVNNPLRRPILDALRPAIEADLGQPVQFVVQSLKAQNGWAFAIVRPQQLNGREIDFRRTRYGEYMDQGSWDGPTTYALLRNTGGRWRTVDFVIGPTDVAWEGWPQEHGAPRAIFTLD